MYKLTVVFTDEIEIVYTQKSQGKERKTFSETIEYYFMHKPQSGCPSKRMEIIMDDDIMTEAEQKNCDLLLSCNSLDTGTGYYEGPWGVIGLVIPINPTIPLEEDDDNS